MALVKMMQILVLLVLCASLSLGKGFLRQQFPHKMVPMVKNGVDPGKPLFLSPYIEKGDIQTGRRLSLVQELKGTDVKSYSGYLTVNKTYDSNLFFWFFPAQKGAADAPVLLWLQGGPGGSSMFGLFSENGPFTVDAKLRLVPRNVTWNSKYSMLYIDNPVGTGFSFTKSDAGYCTTETEVAENLYSALAQFFRLFPEYKTNDFYLTGESYAGKYIPAVAHRIHKESHPKQVLLRGVAIGDGFSDPETMIPQYGDYIYELGMFDENERDYFNDQTNKAVQMIKAGKYKEAFKKWDAILNGDESGRPSFFTNVTGSTNYYNYMMSGPYQGIQYYNQYLALPEVRKAIHVGNLPYNDGSTVEKKLEGDILNTVKPWLAEIMNYYKVLIYSGQLDIIVAAPLTEAMLQTVDWQYKEEYKRTKKMVWKVKPSDTEVAGYVRRVHDFYQVIVRGGGHLLPHDQPERSLDMLDRFISGRPFA